MQIFKLLQKESKFKIDRVCIAGSAGKRTTIFDSDIDCVLFINDERPLFEGVLDDFKKVLIEAKPFGIKKTDLVIYKSKTRKFSLHLKAMGFEFDILPATNFTKGYQLDGDELIDKQQQQVLAEIGNNPQKAYEYSSSLAEAAIRFMRKQSSFVHEMVRITKFW